MRILVLLHDAYGGRGGIAKFNRDLLGALCSYPATREVVCLPRVIVEETGPLPKKLDYRLWAAGGKALFAAAMAKELVRPSWYDLIVCGHIRLTPALRAFELRNPATPTGLVMHGVDAWEPFGGAEVTRQLGRLDWFLSVSDFTKRLFCAWSQVPAEKGVVIPNAVDIDRFTPGPARRDLVERYKLRGKTVLMGMARLDTRERYKGFDEVMEAMPTLLKTHPKLVYLICGDGTDRPRLEQKAKDLGLADKVIFTGYVDEADKVDHYRLADVFLLAGWGEGFGIVLIEAMACGVPSIASNLDASSEAVGDGRFGFVVNPKQPDSLIQGIEAAIARGRARPAGLETFSQPAFERRVHAMLLDPLAARIRPQ